MKLAIETLDNSNRENVRQIFFDKCGDFVVTKGHKHFFEDLDGLIARDEDKIVGVLTFKKSIDEVEIISLDSITENIGIGTALLNKMVDFVKLNFIKRLWLITTNDNLNALKFYQKRNWTISAIYKDAVTETRKIKPTIPMTGCYNIPLRHEIELEYEERVNY